MELPANQKAILQTVSYFDVLDYPLTLLELHNFLAVEMALAELAKLLQAEELIKLISRKNGFYFLAGREELVELRRQRYGLAIRKLKIADFYARWLNGFPWVKAVAIYSSLSLKNSRSQGDLDFFVITANGRVWSARFFINTFLKIFGLRPRPGRTADKICISYLADESNLDLSKVNSQDDYYYYYGTGAFTFLAGEPKVINEFFSTNDWIRNFLPNWQPSTALTASTTGKKYRLEKLCGLIKEVKYKNWQFKVMPDRYKQNEDGEKIVLADGLIKLHDNDKRLKYNQLFKNRLDSIINSVQS